MLSKIALLVLGCIAEKPLNPYHLTKLFARLNTEHWFPMATSSIYAAIRSLVKKGYIEGRKVRSGNMPQKTVYVITSQGKKVLLDNLTNYLREPPNLVTEFDLTLLFLFHLPKEQVIAALRAQKVRVEREIAGRKRACAALESTIPYNGMITMRHGLYQREADLKTLTELLQHVEADEDWNRFPVLDLLQEE